MAIVAGAGAGGVDTELEIRPGGAHVSRGPAGGDLIHTNLDTKRENLAENKILAGGNPGISGLLLRYLGYWC